LILHVFFYSAI
jgi:hypothetical protein